MELAEYEQVVDKTLTLEVDGETHTLGNVLRDVMWAHPHVDLASYSQEHPSKTEILFRCQTSGIISGEQAVVEALHMSKEMLSSVQEAMTAAVEKYETAGGAEEEEGQ